jgi:hypothetical protein
LRAKAIRHMTNRNTKALYKGLGKADILTAVSKTRPRAVRVLGAPILTVFSFSGSSMRIVQPR